MGQTLFIAGLALNQPAIVYAFEFHHFLMGQRQAIGLVGLDEGGAGRVVREVLDAQVFQADLDAVLGPDALVALGAPVGQRLLLGGLKVGCIARQVVGHVAQGPGLGPVPQGLCDGVMGIAGIERKCFGGGVENLGQPVNLDRQCGAGWAQSECFGVLFAGQFGIDVAQVFHRGDVAGIGFDGHFQRTPGFVVLALLGVQGGQVVVGLGQFRVFGAQGFQQVDGFGGLTQLRQHLGLQETHLRIAGVVADVALRQGLGLAQLARVQQLRDLAVIVSQGGHGAQTQP